MANSPRLRDDPEKLIEFVRLGFHDCSLNFTIRLGRLDHLADVLNAAGPYNEFDPECVFLALADVFPKAMGVEFGRKSSPVLYLEVPDWTQQMMGFENGEPRRRLGWTERRGIAMQAMAALRKAGAQTVNYRAIKSPGTDLRSDEELPDLSPETEQSTIRGFWG